jgi:type II secretory pathway component PulK
MNKKGSIFILFLWVMVFLALLAFSVAFRTRLSTNIEGFELRRFERTYDFLSTINLARLFIESDLVPNIDSKMDDWYGVPVQFMEMGLSQKFELEIQDEESKINLNKAEEPFFIKFFELLKEKGLRLETNPKDLAASIAAWRGLGLIQGSTLGFKHKKDPFETVEELRLIQHITPNDYGVLKPFVTVYSLPVFRQMKVNLNTVHPYILEALIFSLAGGDFEQRELFEKIMKFRDEAEIFRREDFDPNLFIQKLTLNRSPSMVVLVNQLFRFLTVDSEYFSVRVSHVSGDESFILNAILGPRFFHPVLNQKGTTLSRSPGTVVSLPLEILSWQEGNIL